MWMTLLVLAAAPVKLAVNDFSTSGTIDRQIVGALQERFAQGLARPGRAEVLTPRVIAAVLGLERQRQLLGCQDDSCLAELSGALGVDALAVGDVVKLDATILLNVRVVDVRNAKTLASASATAQNFDGLLVQVDAVAADVERRLLHHLRGAPLAKPIPVAPWLVMGIGLTATVAGSVLLATGLTDRDAVVANGQSGQLPWTPGEATLVLRNAAGRATAGLIVGAVGLSTIVGGLLWRVLGFRDAPIALWFEGGRASVALGGVW